MSTNLNAWSAIEIGLPVDSLERNRSFWVDCLGFKPYGFVNLPQARVESFRFDDCMLKLTYFSDPKLRPVARDPSIHATYITLRLGELDTALQNCIRCGVPILIPATSVTSKEGKVLRYAFIADPMGNRIELVEGDPWTLLPS